ncbi:MAG: isoprenyl transferase [Phycisphaerales bacterium]|nr:MAG: isoprenyl transferase [Phycisphaerales bacterium]
MPMTEDSLEAVITAELPDVPPASRPRHIAIIMDGNGRWALKRGQARVEGHRAGAETVDRIVTACGRLGIEVLTLYSFSIENWQRPVEEVNTLMDLYVECLVRERDRLIENNVRFLQLGRREGLPPLVLEKMDETVKATRNCTGLTLALALNYGSRTEITDAVRAIADKVKAGKLDADVITEQTIADHLYTAGLPDPDLLIRTAGEMRISNYLLWQISYAELYVTDVCWPDFTQADLHEAIREYARRNRRYGGLDESNS